MRGNRTLKRASLRVADKEAAQEWERERKETKGKGRRRGEIVFAIS